MDTIISQLQPHQWRDYKEIRLAALKSEPNAFAWTYEELADKPDEYWMERVSGSGFYFVAKIGEKQVGTAGLHLQSNDGKAGSASIVGVFVDSSFRRRGIGEKMLSHIFNKLKEHPEIHTVQVNVHAGQEAARSLYTKLGFVKVEVMPGLQHDGEEFDELILEKSLYQQLPKAYHDETKN